MKKEWIYQYITCIIKRKKRKVIVDKPIYYELAAMNLSNDEIVDMFRVRANELGTMEF